MEKDKRLKRASPSTIQDKFLVGYQGWFTCHGDGEPLDPGHHGWLHWFNAPIPDGGRPCIDLWPDVSEYSPSELFPAPGLKLKSGEQAFLFSSRHPKTVQRHFHWMAKHGIDGAFLQRFVGQCDLEAGNEGARRIRDEVGDRVMEAAEKEGRVFAIMYDVTGVAPERVQRILERDWVHLVRNKGILDSPNYLREKGRPVIALWGFGFENSRHSPEVVRNITEFFRHTTPGGVYILAGAPGYWRTASNDADRNPAFLDVWLNAFDAISPWTVGRYNTDEEIDRFAENNLKADMDLLKKRTDEGHKKVDYIPVVLPGGSGYNLSQGKWAFNGIKRKGGRFLWKQIFHAKRLGVRTIYGAMWDEYDEGTAFMPAVAKSSMLPQSDKFSFFALDEDGFEVPPDWYMRICGFAAEGLRSERLIHETFPSKELQDYWATRPKYEEKSDNAAASSSKAPDEGSAASGYQQWLAEQNEDKDEPPPPPYSLEAEEPATSSQQPVQQASGSGSAVGAAFSSAAFVPATSSNVSGQTPNGHANLPSSSSSQSAAPSDAVSSLADNFSQHHISARPGEIVSSQSGRPAPPHPPPRHPSQGSFSNARPMTSMSPPQHPSQTGPARPNFQPKPSRPGSRPSTASGSTYHQSTSSIPSLPGADRPTTQQWPPPEWNVGTPSTQPSYKPYQPDTPPEDTQQNWSSYPEQTGAKLSRPQTFSATSLRPVQQPVRPSSAMAQMTPPFPSQSYAMPFAPDSTYGGPSHELSGNSYFCPGVSNVPPPLGGPSQMPTTSSYATPPHSPPATSYGPDHHTNATQYDPLPQTSSFPHSDGYFAMANYRPPPSISPHPSPMPNNNLAFNDPSPHSCPSMPNPYFPEPSNVPPPMPPRPAMASPYNNYQSSNSYQPSYFPPSTTPGPLGFAFSALDKVAGRKTREQMESGVDSITQTGTKLFGKFMK